VLLLILESFGSTELLFILVMALVFFGPRKLPQISRSLGKSLAEFRRASEDFKRTWEKEVAMDTSFGESQSSRPGLSQEDEFENRILDDSSSPADQVSTDYSVPRESRSTSVAEEDHRALQTESASEQIQEPLPKRDWL
jgi:TatA/E family protein of Tat protein translocase